MGCIKPPLNVTEPSPRGASRLAFRRVGVGVVSDCASSRTAAGSAAATTAADLAERVAGEAATASASVLSSAKRDAQRALAAARAAGLDAQAKRLQAALSKIQHAEAKAPLEAERGTESQRQQWVAEYLESTRGSRDLVTVQTDDANYIFDATVLTPVGTAENRVVGVYGRSGESNGPRDKSRMSGHPNPRDTDRGHLLALASGGGYDINLIPQNSRLNRGHSEEGKLWRKLERYMAGHIGTEFFVRPTYGDTTDYPTELEFGIRLTDGTWRVERFNNQP